IAYNLGVNTQLALLTGAYIRTPIDLSQNKNIFGDKKAFNIQTMLISLPMFLLPILIFIITSIISSTKHGFIAVSIDVVFGFILSILIINTNYIISSTKHGIIAVGIAGVVDFTIKNMYFDRITKLYKKHKYVTLQSYKKN